jgi:hypothetical protein
MGSYGEKFGAGLCVNNNREVTLNGFGCIKNRESKSEFYFEEDFSFIRDDEERYKEMFL